MQFITAPPPSLQIVYSMSVFLYYPINPLTQTACCRGKRECSLMCKKKTAGWLPVVAGVLLDPCRPNKKCQTFIAIDIRFITKPYRDCCIIQQSVFSWCQNRRGIPRGREGARKDWRQVNEKKSCFSLMLSQECWMGKRKRGDISRGTHGWNAM